MFDGWKCGKCEKKYNFDEFHTLDKVKAVETDSDVKPEHGYDMVCTCGYVFHKDKWRIRDTVEIETPMGVGLIDVSTIFLELCHFGYWYESMLFVNEKSKIDFDLHQQWRFIDKEGAEKWHKKVVKMLQDKQFDLVPVKYELSLTKEDEDDS